MNTYLHILVYFNLLFSMTGVELAKKMKDRPKPFDTQSNSSMILTNKKWLNLGSEKGVFGGGVRSSNCLLYTSDAADE